jgi:hypothetical protein
MKFLLNISLFLLLFLTARNSYAQQKAHQISFEFYNHTFNLAIDPAILIGRPFELSDEKIRSSYQQVNEGRYEGIMDSLKAFRRKHQLNDWLYYQLVRKTAEQLGPKKEDYTRYTFYKWFLMVKSGYDTRLALADGRIILYVYNDEDISDIPFLEYENKKYMCLNIHDYAFADLNKVPPKGLISIPDAKNSFSYRVTRMPDFKPEDYSEKKLAFKYRQKTYHFNVKQNQDIESIFKNYPGVDFATYFNIPLSKETYSSLIPVLKKNVSKMKQKKGIDYLMRFTRYAFLYEDDERNYGKEKRLSPEGTLFATYSDCDDRAALFFYLVKEIYNLPMIAMLYPTHVTIAVQFDKPVGQPIVYNGKIYSVCEPTPQKENLAIGQIAAKFKNKQYEVVYAYQPKEVME